MVRREMGVAKGIYVGLALTRRLMRLDLSLISLLEAYIFFNAAVCLADRLVTCLSLS